MGDGATFAIRRDQLGFHSWLWTGLVPALVALGGLVALDARSDVIITGFFAIVPFATAMSGDVRVTAVVGVLAVVASGMSGLWNENFDTTSFWVRFGLGLSACLFSVFIAFVLERSNRTSRRLQLLNEVAEEGGERPSLADTLGRILDLAVPELADLCVIDAISGGDSMERIAVRAHGPDRERIERYLESREQTVQADVAFGGDGLILNTHVGDSDLERLAADAEDLERLRGLGVRSYVVVSLRSRGRRIGVLSLILASSGRRHSREDARFSRVLADRIALSLDNAGLFSDLESVEMRMDTVMGVLDEPVTITERSGRLIFANEAALELAGAGDLGELAQAEAGTAEFDLYDEGGSLLGRGTLPWQLPELERGRIVRMVHAEHGEETWLRIRSRAIPAIDNRPMYLVTAYEDVSEMKLAEFAQSVFASTGELLAASTDPELMLQRLVSLLTPRLADSCAVLMPRGDGGLELAAVADAELSRERMLTAAIHAHPIHRDGPGMPELLSAREPVLFDAADPGGWPDAAQPLAAGIAALGLGSVMAQPLRVGERLIGIIGFANSAERRPFTGLEQRIALRISERVALAIDNARIASERAEIAETLQNGLRPSAMPELPGWALSALYSPAGAENRAGGDFYDLLRIEGGWMVVIGDVTGHGARAASLTALARYTLRAASAMTGDPRRALAELNRALLRRPGAALCSVAALTLDQPARGRVRVAVAGHPPPLIVHEAGTREVDPPGPILGAFEDADWELETLSLEPGDQLVVYTDGVVEARGQGGRFGADRLCRCLGDCSDPDEAIQRIRSELAQFAVGELQDDAAALAIMLEDLGEGSVPAGSRTAAGAGVSLS
ncbi:MAG: SpoIIE family protein phosphatase [Solirubrobacterales bacterium]|nr:SpoIIE family protein phosphatase [Solirubrobacterales bacterium]